MTRRGGPVLLWLVATAAAIAVASAAIAQVGREVTLDTPLDARLAQASEAPATPEAAASEQLPSAPVASAPVATAPVATAPVASEPAVRTYDVIGGRAAVVVAGGTVDVLWATPREAFRASVERAADGHELRVEFRSDAHRSRIEIAVEDGQVVDEIEEDDRR